MSWHDRAACRAGDPETWFHDHAPGDTPQYDCVVCARALTICSTCPVRLECLKAGLDERYGIFGGSLPGHRRKVLRALEAQQEVLWEEAN